MAEKVRVRFAPSPTGNLHVGGVRTALFNWLYARHNGGSFILRIDDTDPERSTKAFLENILESMRWLGLDWDEGPGKEGKFGPYFQSQKLDRYRELAQNLLKEGKAFKCYCSPEELDAMRAQAAREHKPPRYDGRCLNLKPGQAEKYEAEGRKPTIRFRLPEGGPIVMEDVIRGRVEFPRDMLDHFVMVRSDGKPVYNYVTVIDEHDLAITHVIRGDDHLSNTPKQVLVAEALGFTPPRYAHLPQILGMDRARLSKRHGAAAVIDLREEGYLPEAVINFLALLGWSFDGVQELFEPGELAEKFTLERVGMASAVFDEKKLEWMNGVYIRKTPPEKLLPELAARLETAFAGKPEYDPALTGDAAYRDKVLLLLRDNLKALSEVPKLADFFFRREVLWEDDAVAKLKVWPKAKEILAGVRAILAGAGAFEPAGLEASFREESVKAGFKFKDYVHPTRFAVTGRVAGPSLFHLLEVMGKPACLARLDAAIKTL